MNNSSLGKRVSLETPHIEEALFQALSELPDLCRPVAEHILKAGGKRLRPLLAILCARALGYENNDIHTLAASMEMLHAATLLHDDILDNAQSRRGKQAAHLIYGVNRVILAGDALLAAGNTIVASFGNPALVLCYSRATSQTAAGEILEMDSLHRPNLTHEQYLAIARGKTACLISQACALGATAAGAAPVMIAACADYGENLGVAFQMVDDALDFAPEEQTGKPCAGDLREGKMTPPLRLYRQHLSANARKRFDEAFSGAGFEEEEVRQIAVEVRKYIPDAISLADACLEKARSALCLLPSCEEKEILLQMTEYVRSRQN